MIDELSKVQANLKVSANCAERYKQFFKKRRVKSLERAYYDSLIEQHKEKKLGRHTSHRGSQKESLPVVH